MWPISTIIAVTVAVVACLFILNAMMDDGTECSVCNADGSCQADFSSSSSVCDPDPSSRRSCCSLNPIIKSQVQAMNGYTTYDVRLPNLASKYLGATVACTRKTKPYRHPLGTPASEKTNKPSVALEPGPVVAGKNWHFIGVGRLVVKIFQPALISGFTVVHASRYQIPVGYENSAPQNFLVMGMNDLAEEDPFLFGNYTYDIRGSSAQAFPVQSCSKETYQLIEFQILSNHGNPNYTALYQVKIHGLMDPPPGNGGSTMD